MNDASVFDGAKYVKAQQAPSTFSFYDPAPLFRKEFTVDEEICEASMLVQSPGFAKFFLNGQDITEDILISPISDYDKILWYHIYDVTKLLRKGKNAIGVIAGNGYLNESFKSAWDYDTVAWRDAPQFLLCLQINGRAAVVSDRSWKTTREGSHIIYNHLRSGEYVDMRKYDTAWLHTGYHDSDWLSVIEKEPVGELRLCPCPPVREVEKISPVSVVKTESGYLADFGVNISGYAEITLQAERGSEIKLLYAEELDENQRPKHNGMDTPYYYAESPFQLSKLIASGGTDTFKPMFSYYGFRYVRIDGLRDKPISLCAYFTHNDVKRISDFESGNAVLNYIYDAGIRSTYSNMFWCMTDCPTREKLGWTNDAQASVEQTLINFDMLPLYEKWFEDIKASMFPDGSLHGTIPAPNWEWGHKCGPVCDCLLYEIPYKIYLYTGSSHMLTEAVPFLERYAAFLEQKSKENHVFDLGDWLGYTSSKTIPKEFIRDFYLIKALRITLLANQLAGHDCGAWQEKLDRYTGVFLERYLDGANRCVINEQSAIAMMMEAGICTDRRTLADQLISVLYRDNFKLTCGMVGIQYLYDALSHSGRADIAYRLITESEPGYKTWLENGATTLWERWDGKDSGSHNHHMFSGVIAWFYKSLLGLAPAEQHPAFDYIELDPCFIKELGFVRGSMDSVRGRIQAEWVYENGRYIYTVDIPAGVKASFRGKALSAGKNKWIIEEAEYENH